jgi:hypothetical protein
MIIGEARKWLVDDLHKKLQEVVQSHQHLTEPYFILVVTRTGAIGPSIHSKENKDTAIDGKRVISTRIIVMKRPPPVAMLGTALWYVNNKKGLAKCIYVLPIDKPTVPVEKAAVSELVFESAKKADGPILHN